MLIESKATIKADEVLEHSSPVTPTDIRYTKENTGAVDITYKVSACGMIEMTYFGGIIN